MPDLTSHILFDAALPKKARIILCKTGPDPVWMASSGSGESSGLILAKRNQPATSFPFSDSSVFFHRQPRSYGQKNSQDPSWFWPTVSGFGQMDPVWKQTGVQESPGPLLSQSRLDANRIWHVYGVGGGGKLTELRVHTILNTASKGTGGGKERNWGWVLVGGRQRKLAEELVMT